MSCVGTDIEDINLPTFLNAHIHSSQAGCVHPFAVLFLPLSFQLVHAFLLASTADIVNHPFSIPFTITSKENLQFILCSFIMKACQVYHDLELHDLVTLPSSHLVAAASLFLAVLKNVNVACLGCICICIS